MSYSRILAQYPYVMLAGVLIIATTCLVVTITIGTRPNFDDPQLGFEPRGTEISRRLRAHLKLLDETHSGRSKNTAPYFNNNNNQWYSHSTTSTDQKPPTGSSNNHIHNLSRNYSEGDGQLEEDEDDEGIEEEDEDFSNMTEPFLCGPPRKEYGRVAFQSISGSSLLTTSHLKSMCEIESSRIRVHRSFENSCVRYTYSKLCCPSWSLPNYVALLNNRTSCHDITDADVNSVVMLLQSCVEFYRKLDLSAQCYDTFTNKATCSSVPPQCQTHNAVYHIFHYLTDVKFLKDTEDKVDPRLKYAMMFLPVAAGSASEQLFKDLEKESQSLHDTELVAVNFGIKHNLFDYYLMADTVWFCIAMAVIFVLMWLYTASLFITAMTIISIMLSLLISYFLYTMVFNIKFYPFMNLLTVVILVGIGADDVFIYCKVWALAKLEKNVGTLEKIVSDTLRHASLSMFVSSFTTAAAFFANYISRITALQCFAIYAGTTIIINLILMVTWIPATIVAYEKWCSDCLICYSPDIYTPKRGFCFYFCKIPYKTYYIVTDWTRIFFEKLLPCIVVKPRLLWLVLYGSLGIAGMFIVFYKPRLKLPSSNEFQVFSMDHPFEVYDFQVKDQFWFEKAAGSNVATMPLTIVWGVKPVDNGNHLDPFSEGSLVYDTSFNVATPAAQKWLLNFCTSLRRTSMYQLLPGPQITNCFIESFKKFMEQDCEGMKPGESNEPCCRTNKFPYSEKDFRYCMKLYQPLLSSTPTMYLSSLDAGLRYSKETGQIVALIVEFYSKQPFSFNHTSMHEFFISMNQWVMEQMLKAPKDMRGGWFISHLEFYDLQETLARDTPIAIGVSIAVAMIVAFCTTLNLLISVFAIISITGTIFVTVGTLVLLGWQLNILESVVITIAIGLSMDFTLHYGMAYRLSPDLDQEMRVCCSLSRMGSPVAMAALTSFIAGALMMPSTVLAYRQLGTFLMLAMAISWLYSTFFFQTLLRTFGPQGGFGQFHWPSSDCCSGGGREHVDKTVYALSESTVSSSSTNHANSSETHELEPLTERDANKQALLQKPRSHPGHPASLRHHQQQAPSNQMVHYKKTSTRLQNNNFNMPDQENNSKCDTLVTIQCQNNKRPQVVATNNYKNRNDCVCSPDDVTVQTLLGDQEDSDHCELSQVSQETKGEDDDGCSVWKQRTDVV